MTSVLIVEDDFQLRTAVARDLEAQGYAVSVVQSVDEAIECLQSTHIDVLLTDLRMSGRDGIDLLQQVSTISPHTSSLLMSAFATARDFQAALAHGAVSVLCKPFTPRELRHAIEQAVECGSGFHGTIHGLTLIDVLQMFHLGRRSITVLVGGQAQGSIHLENGEIIHAESGTLWGEEALGALLNSPSGSMQTTAVVSVPHTISRNFESLLLDTLRLLDEAKAHTDEVEISFDGDIPTPAHLKIPDLDDQTSPSEDVLDYVAQRWAEATASLQQQPDWMSAHVFRASDAACLVLAGSALSAGAAQLSRLGADTASAVATGVQQGVSQFISDHLTLAIIWDFSLGYTVLLSAAPENASGVMWFRSYASTLARHLFHW